MVDGFSFDDNPDVNLMISDGTLVITEFNLIEKVIKGTFEFSFAFENIYTGEVTDPFECINGTFDYSLDHSYFN